MKFRGHVDLKLSPWNISFFYLFLIFCFVLFASRVTFFSTVGLKLRTACQPTDAICGEVDEFKLNLCLLGINFQKPSLFSEHIWVDPLSFPSLNPKFEFWLLAPTGHGPRSSSYSHLPAFNFPPMI